MAQRPKAQEKKFRAVVNGAHLRACREKRGLTQMDLASMIGAHPNEIGQYEKEARDMHCSRFVDLLDALDGDPRHFLRRAKKSHE